MKRRNYLRTVGHLFGVSVLGAATARVFSPPSEEAAFIAQGRRFAWQINPDLCRQCGICETACVRKPSAVKAFNDPKKCSNCVVCYGHITNKYIDSDKIDRDGERVCPVNAVTRTNFSGGIDGMFLYEPDPRRCIACGKCVKRCNNHGTGSMFLAIRPDLCLGCNECAIAIACPHGAIERIPREAVDDYLGDYWFDSTYLMGEDA